MDAREYLSRQGVSLDRDPDKPNTLEEKAWDRARGAGHQRPKSGTPYDWEEWERYHGDLAGDANTLEQKIDKDAHQETRQGDQQQTEKEPGTHHTPAEAKRCDKSVGYFDPVTATATRTELSSADSPSGEARSSLQDMSGLLKVAYIVLSFLLPPLAVGLAGGNARRVGMTCVLTMVLWFPGVIYAVRWLLRCKP